MRNTTVKWIFATRFQSRRGKFKPIVSKPLLFSFLLKKQDKHTQVPRFWRNSRGKKTEDVLVLWKLSSLFDESNYHEQARIQQALKARWPSWWRRPTGAEPCKPNHPTHNSSHQQQEYKETGTTKYQIQIKSGIKTHLTTTGVCTVPCPETSGT